jgi:hypothetical protein
MSGVNEFESANEASSEKGGLSLNYKIIFLELIHIYWR